LAAGGIVKHGGGGILANIGEGRYDEAVIPLKPGMGMGGDIHVHFHGPVAADAEDWVVTSMTKALRSARGSGLRAALA
jgi:hypothetical protein